MTNDIENGFHYQWDHENNVLTITIRHVVNTVPHADGSTDRNELINALIDIRDMIDASIEAEHDHQLVSLWRRKR